MNTTTKTCTKCKIEKPLSDFHRRGHRHQNICKLCRLEAAKQPNSPRIKKDNSKNFSSIGERINALEPRIRMIARQYSKDPHQAEDIFQHICEKLLLQADPADSDARILTTAKRRAGDYVNTEKTYSFWVGGEEELGGTGEEEDLDAFEIYIGDQQTPEDMVIENEEISAIQKALETLTPENRKVVALLGGGYSQAEIAKELGVSRAAVSIRVNLIAQKLAAQGLAL